jgi:hypothetical protein
MDTKSRRFDHRCEFHCSPTRSSLDDVRVTFLSVDEKGKLPRTIPNKFALGEGLDIGTDLGSAVDSTYKVPFTFTGKVEKVTFDLK